MRLLKNIVKFISAFALIILFVFAVFMAINAVVCRLRGRPASFFGISFAIVMSESMEPEISKGDLIIFKLCDYGEVSVGDTIVFVGGEGFGSIEGQLIVHSVAEISENGIVTKGVNMDTNPMPDTDLVTEENLFGKCVYNSALFGKVFNIFSRYGILIMVALIFLSVLIFKLIEDKRKKLRN